MNTTMPSGSFPAAAPVTFPCPECGTPLRAGTPTCASCGIRLTGPLAARLWQVDQQIAGLQRESRSLRTRLLAPPDADELARSRAWGAAVGAPPAQAAPAPGIPGLPSFRAPAVAVPAGGPSGQQVLLGLGALLLLSGVAFFLAVVWIVVGLVGQALIMLVLTGTAAGGAVVATRRGLVAAAETAVVIASGFVVLDLAAAYGKGLAGLDRFSPEEYWSVAGWVGAAILVGLDRLVPQQVRGERARTPFTYWPVASSLAVAALVSLAVAVAPDDVSAVGLSVLGLLMTLVLAGFAWLVARLDVRSRPMVDSITWSAVPPMVAAVVTFLVHYLMALGAAYGLNPVQERYTGMLLLLVAPAAVAVAMVARRGGSSENRTWLLGLVVVGLVPVLGVPLMDTPRVGVSLLSLPVGAALLWLALRGAAGRSEGLLEWFARGVLVLLFGHGLLLELDGAETGVDLVAGRTTAGPGAWWVAALPALVLAASAALSAVRHYSSVPAAVAQIAGFASLMTALRDAEPMIAAVLWLLAATVSVVVAGVVHAVHHESTQAEGYAADDAARRRRASETVTLETLNLLAGVVQGTLAVIAASDVDARVTGTTLLLAGAMLLAYAVLPGRLGMAYFGTAVVGLGAAVLLDHGGVTTVEAYTAPVVALLAVIGAIEAYRNRAAGSWLTMGPALVVAFVPSTVVALSGGDVLRLVAVTAGAVIVLVIGLLRHLQAPVATGALVLGLVAVQQGGPLVEYVPGFVVLVSGGAVLLAIGVAWESAVAAGRRGAAWFGSLR